MGIDNPMNSQQTLKVRRSYRALAVAAGFRMVSAVPLKLSEKVTTLRHPVVCFGHWNTAAVSCCAGQR